MTGLACPIQSLLALVLKQAKGPIVDSAMTMTIAANLQQHSTATVHSLLPPEKPSEILSRILSRIASVQ